MKDDLTIKQKRFAAEYVKGSCSNATEAAIKAGYSDKNARQAASENLTKPNIQAEIARLQAEVDKQVILTVYERKKIFGDIALGKRPARAVKTSTQADGSTLKVYIEPGVGLDGLNKMEHIYTSEAKGIADEVGKTLFDFIIQQGKAELSEDDSNKKPVKPGKKQNDNPGGD